MARGSDSAWRGLAVCEQERTATFEDRRLDLTSREFEIVRRLATHPGWVFSAEQLSAEEAGGDYSPESVSVLVSRVRRKLAAAGAPDLIDTVRGFGYRIRPQVSVAVEPRAGADVRAALLDAEFRVQEAVLRAEREGAREQIERAVEVLETARRSLEAILET